MEPETDYAEPGPLTGLEGLAPEVLEGIGNDPVQVCMPVHLLVVQPDPAKDLGLGEARLGESNVRPAARILGALLALNPAPVRAARSAGQRVVGTCRHFALLSCAFLRYRAIAARVRCGFATYFQAGHGLDHWITEFGDLTAQVERLSGQVGRLTARAGELERQTGKDSSTSSRPPSSDSPYKKGAGRSLRDRGNGGRASSRVIPDRR